MKKLITAAVASAFAFLAIGAGNYQPGGTSFESSPSGEKTVEALTAHEDDGVGTGDARYWIYGGGDTTAVVGVVTNGAPVVPSDVPSRPDQFAGIANNQYLNLAECEATNVLYRAVKSVAGKTVGTLDGESIGDGFYLDTLVKFTAADSTNNFELASGDKLAITYIEETEDDDGDGVLLSNIVVRAGYVENSTATEKTYIMELPDELKASFAVTNWHRLTVRAINVGYADAPVGFVIYLDGNPNPLTYALDVVPGDQAYTTALAGNAIVNGFLYNSTIHALLPSAVDGVYASVDKLAAVGFKGTGCVDDISFVSGTPGFVDEGKGVTIDWDEGVETVKVWDDNTGTYYVGSALGGEVVTNLAYISTNFTVESTVVALKVEAGYRQSYEAGAWESGSGSAYSAVDDTLTLASEGETTLSIKSLLPKFEVNGVNYGSFQDALENAVGTQGAPATIKMLASWDGDITFDSENVNYIILDLAGQTLTGDSDAAIHTGVANLTITNSTVEIGHVVAPDFDSDKSGVAVVCDGAATLTVTAGIFDGAIVPDAQGVVIVVTGGKFYDNEYAEDPTGEFYLAGSVDTDKYTISNADEDYYFTVSSSVEPPAPTTYELRIPAVTGASATVTDKATSSVIADLTAIEDGTVVTVTWEADDGYKITAGATEEITMDDDKTADEPTVVAITYATLTITPVENCTIVVSNATEEVATGATFDVDDAVELTIYRTPAEGYQLDNCAATETITMDQNQTVTAAVKQSGGIYPSYIDPTDTEETAKYTAWATYAEVSDVATGEVNEEAYLLNCKPSEVAAAKAAFKFTSISYDSTQSKWVTPTTTSYNNRDYNGEVVVKQYSDVGCTTESSTGTFFKAVLQ